jgi:autotransporter-associated beta strand protein
MTISTWDQSPASLYYGDGLNWSAGVPSAFNETAEFEASNQTTISLLDHTEFPGEWLFNTGATQYSFEIAPTAQVGFLGNGIVINAGSAQIFNFGTLEFLNSSSASGAVIDNFLSLQFFNSSNAGAAVIHTFGFGAKTAFVPDGVSLSTATGGSAQFVTDIGGVVDFSGTLGPDSLGHVTAGSIAGAGTYKLGRDQLTIGLNGLSTEVSGPIEDGGDYGGSGASLVKVGPGTLKLSHAGNTYTGGTTIEQGTLYLDAIGAAGPGAIAFVGRATLRIENAALSGHVFASPIEFFGKRDSIDLAGLHFHTGATTTYRKASHHLTVHSGHVTDTLLLLSPHGTHFIAANDGHGGTKVTLDSPGAAAHGSALLAGHDLGPGGSAGDHTASGAHMSDFLFTA